MRSIPYVISATVLLWFVASVRYSLSRKSKSAWLLTVGALLVVLSNMCTYFFAFMIDEAQSIPQLHWLAYVSMWLNPLGFTAYATGIWFQSSSRTAK